MSKTTHVNDQAAHPDPDSTSPSPTTTSATPAQQNVAECSSSQNLSSRRLSITQVKALSLLAQGLSDSAIARRLGLHRMTINRWRLFDPIFASRLNRLRKAIWANTLDRLRSLLPRSLWVLSCALKSTEQHVRLRAAIQLLKIAGASRLAPRIGPDNTFEALAERIQRERALENHPSVLRQLDPPASWELEQTHAALLKHIADCEAPDMPPDCP